MIPTKTDSDSPQVGGSIPTCMGRRLLPVFILLLLPMQTCGLLRAEETLQLRPRPHITQEGQLDHLAAAKVLQDFRGQRLGGDYSFKFELRHMPRRGPTTTYKGQLWGTWNASGAQTRIIIPGNGNEKMNSLTLLVHNGPQPKIWRLPNNPPALARQLLGEELFEPLLPGLIVTPFDLQMPFIFWPNYAFEGKTKKLGRTLFVFLMYPPEITAIHNPALGAVRIFLEEKSRQWLKAQLVDKEGQILKSFKIISVKRIGNEGFPKTIDFFDERSRSKTRFRITAAALGQKFPKDHFLPEHLAGAPPAILPDAFTGIK